MGYSSVADIIGLSIFICLAVVAAQGNYRIVGLPDGEEIMTLAFFVLTQYRCVTDGQTDGQTRYCRKYQR